MEYRVITWEEAYEKDLVWRVSDDWWRKVLIRVNDDGSEELVYADGTMEPEDTTLGRDLSSFVHELQWLATKYNALKRLLEVR